MLFSDMGGIDIEEVNEQHPDRVGRAHLSNLDRGAGLPRQGGDRADRRDRQRSCTRTTPILARLARLFSEYDMTLAEINPLGELADGRFVALDAHMEMENEARPRQKRAAEGAGRRRRGDPRRRARRPRSRSPARRSTRWTTAAWPAT